jgi:hypothetical protein
MAEAALAALCAGAACWIVQRRSPPVQLHELDRARKEIALLRGQLEAQERLTRLGILAAGVAHEINNPRPS